ncbi:MAG: phosphotransferase [Bacilli bacterium]|nr:phosphotransferase [Bacilli bacterium]
MNDVINLIINKHKDLFGNDYVIERNKSGFTNTIYEINNSFIIKICNKEDNEESFLKEIEFYKNNKDNSLIPRLYYAHDIKDDIPYYYEIIKKIKGVSLYYLWHNFSDKERENIIKQLCNAMKRIHSVKGNNYNWVEHNKNRFNTIYSKIKEMNIFNTDEDNKIMEAYNLFDKYLISDEVVLVHNDLHFDNIFYENGSIKLIDFERSMFAPKDFELDIIYRMVRKPWKFANEECELFTNKEDYECIMKYISKYYPELVNVPNLDKRLAIYDIIYFMNQLLEYPHLEELKHDVLEAVNIVIKKD